MSWIKNSIIYFIIGIILGLIFINQSFILIILTQIIIFTIAAMGLNILTGYAGQVSIGNAAFMSIGAYTSAILSMKLGFPIYTTILISGIFASIFGLIIGFPSLRMKGFYLAIATMAFGVVIEQLISVMPYFGAHDGIRSIPKISSSEFYSYLTVLFVFSISLIILKNIVEGPSGIKWKMVRDQEIVAISFGTNTSLSKLSAFMISAFFSGIAGALYAHCVGYIRASDFGLSRSLDLLAMIMIGGLASLDGSLAGAIIIIGLRFFFSRGFGPWLSVIIGLLLIFFTLFFPQGISWGLITVYHKYLQRPYIAIIKYFQRRKIMDGKFIEVDGLKIFYVEKGEGESILYIHGNTGSSRWWKKVMDIPNHKVYAVDLPNFGRSSHMNTAEIDDYSNILKKIIDKLALISPIIVGHSLGGAIVISFISKFPNVPKAVVLVDSSSVTGLKTPEEHYPIIEMYKTSRDLMYKALSAIAPELKDYGYLNELTDDAMLMAPFSYTAHPRSLEKFNCKGKFTNFTKPVLIMWGKKDIIITKDMVEETKNEFPNSYLVEFDNIGHSIMVEDPELFKDQLLKFINEKVK